eukprot:scaffold149019_cov19-Tisochrysis_lutea.AAC.2
MLHNRTGARCVARQELFKTRAIQVGCAVFLKDMEYDYRNNKNAPKLSCRVPGLTLTLSGISEAEVEDSLDRTPGSKSITRKLPHPQPRIVGNLTVHSFDVAVSPLDHSSGS